VLTCTNRAWGREKFADQNSLAVKLALLIFRIEFSHLFSVGDFVKTKNIINVTLVQFDATRAKDTIF
jgi:hypothetical protein